MSDKTRRDAMVTLVQRALTIDIVGDVTSTVDTSEDLVAWTNLLIRPVILAWRSFDDGHRYLQVQAPHPGPPVNGHVIIQMPCEAHSPFWSALVCEELPPGTERELDRHTMLSAWMAATGASATSHACTPAHGDPIGGIPARG